MDNPQTKVTGRIIKISKSGWGFISSKEIEFTRIFFHWTALRQDTLQFPELRTGMTVEFIPLRVPDKGWRAVHVRVIERVVEPNEMPALPELRSLDDGIDTVNGGQDQ